MEKYVVKWPKSCLLDQCQPEVECRGQDFTEATGELLRSADPTHPDLLSQQGQGLGITILNRSPDDSQAHSQVCIFRPDFLPEFWTCVSKNPLNISTWMLAPNRILYHPQASSSFSMVPPSIQMLGQNHLGWIPVPPKSFIGFTSEGNHNSSTSHRCHPHQPQSKSPSLLWATAVTTPVSLPLLLPPIPSLQSSWSADLCYLSIASDCMDS